MKILVAINAFIWSLVFYNICQAQDLSFTENLKVMATIDGKITWIDCPDWDWQAIYNECAEDGIELNQYMLSWNCIPRCGKYKDDRPDIGAWEYVSGITNEKPWGDYNGVRMDDPQTLDKINEFKTRPENFKTIDKG